ncbi:MAG: hypothetical protein ACI37Z_09800 [Candidatus Gastranaerophilaceae bacterium]
MLNLIKVNLLDFDYKQYFYNFPKDSYLHTVEENQLISILLYNTDVSNMEHFEDLVNNIIISNPNIIDDSYERLRDLGLRCPKCIFNSNKLMEYSLNHYSDMVWGTLSNELPYDEESISSTSKILINIIENNFLDNQLEINKVCKLVIDKSSPQGIIIFRREIINHFLDLIGKFEILYSDKTPLITRNEINRLKGKVELFSFIDYNSTEFTIDFVDMLHLILIDNYTNSDVQSKCVEFYRNVYDVLGETDNETLTLFMFDYMKTTQQIFTELEKIILINNNFSKIQSDYIDIINLFAENNSISYNTIDELDKNNVTSGLSERVCQQIFEADHVDAYIVNACSTNINMIDFYNEKIISFINDIDFYDENSKKYSEIILLQIRNHLITRDIELALNYNALFFGNNIIISKEELGFIPNKELALNFIDKEQINDSNIEYIAQYLNNGVSSQNLTYMILEFVSSINDINIKRALFERLNFDNIQYYRISHVRRSTIRSQMSDAYDFSKVQEQIKYMATTKVSNSEFEKHIKSLISTKKFDNYLQKAYAQYTWKLKSVPEIVISNLCNMDYIQSIPALVYNKMFELGKYRYYVLAKIADEKTFILETSKLDKLYTVYVKLFFEKNLSNSTKTLMSNNSQFVEMMIENKEYKNASETDRLRFTNALQTKESLIDLYDNYNKDVVIKYLSLIKGFKDEDASNYYLELMKNDKSLGHLEILYSHNYNHFVDRTSKTRYTWYYHH